MTRRQRDHLDPAIHRVRVDSLTIFEITEAELEALSRVLRLVFCGGEP